jgi:hypothetical protein
MTSGSTEPPGAFASSVRLLWFSFFATANLDSPERVAALRHGLVMDRRVDHVDRVGVGAVAIHLQRQDSKLHQGSQ